MQNTEKLLSITNLKKYFPVAKRGLLGRKQLYVRANEEISIDIYRGETFGLVGESGCGKSTFGRVVLQLYSQTAGSTVYYGRTLAELAPAYVGRTLKHAMEMIAVYKKKQQRAHQLETECEAAGDDATFFQHQAKNLAVAEAKTAFGNVVKILGGFAALDDPREGAACLLKKYRTDVRIARMKAEIREKEAEVGFCMSQITARQSSDSKRADAGLARLKKQAEKRQAQLLRMAGELERMQDELATCVAEIHALKSRYANDPAFAEYEALLDEGIDLSRLNASEMRMLRKDLQIIFQDPYSSLNPRMTVGQLIGEGLVTHGFFKNGSPQMREYILEIMRQCGLQDYMLHRYPHQFSGGQRQRICIARALAVKPQFIVCDECVSALDVSIQSQIINLLEDLKQKEGLTYLFISHDLSVVRYISDRIGVMYLGNLVELGSAEEVFSDPRHPYTVALLSSIPTTDSGSAHRERIILEGSIPSPIRPPEGCKFHTRCYMACEKCKRVPPPFTEVEKGHFAACHFPHRKIDENGNYLFELPGKKKEQKGE